MLTPSTMLPLGTQAPDFILPDVVTDKSVKLSDFQGKKALLVIFMCRHCPYVVHVKDEIKKIANDYLKQDVGIVGISANDADNYPEDAPSSLREFAVSEKIGFPLLFDETQIVAKSYKAACTPDFFLFDSNQKLVYRGQLDDSRPGSIVPVTAKDLRNALNAVLEGREIPADQKPSTGCNIKWKQGNEPDYF